MLLVISSIIMTVVISIQCSRKKQTNVLSVHTYEIPDTIPAVNRQTGSEFHLKENLSYSVGNIKPQVEAESNDYEYLNDDD